LAHGFLKDLQDRGTFGDMFGGINALFSGFAFAGVVFAIFLQKERSHPLKGPRQEKTVIHLREKTFFLRDIKFRINTDLAFDSNLLAPSGISCGRCRKALHQSPI
jgi:hypothetical protein